jgi:hypothetical protein
VLAFRPAEAGWGAPTQPLWMPDRMFHVEHRHLGNQLRSTWNITDCQLMGA